MWRIVNPDGLRNQVIGAMIQGLGGALSKRIEFETAASRIRFLQLSRAALPDVPKSKRPA